MSKNYKRFKKYFCKNHSKKSHGHPAYVYGRFDGKYKYLGLTHSPITRGKRNVRLKKNPNPFDKKRSYVRPFSRSDPIKYFSKKLRGWKLSRKDKCRIRKIKRIKEK